MAIGSHRRSLQRLRVWYRVVGSNFVSFPRALKCGTAHVANASHQDKSAETASKVHPWGWDRIRSRRRYRTGPLSVQSGTYRATIVRFPSQLLGIWGVIVINTCCCMIGYVLWFLANGRVGCHLRRIVMMQSTQAQLEMAEGQRQPTYSTPPIPSPHASWGGSELPGPSRLPLKAATDQPY